MSDLSQRPLLSRKGAEVGFALLLALAGAVVIAGARELDTGWGSSGPEAGYFPLRIGILLVVASLAVALKEALRSQDAAGLLSVRAAGRVTAFALPLAVLVAAIPWVGVYLGAAAYLMVAVGAVARVPWARAAGIAVCVPAVLFVAFEFGFRAPLPKGPLGPLLGLP